MEKNPKKENYSLSVLESTENSFQRFGVFFFFLYPVIKSSFIALEVIEIITPLLIQTQVELPDLNVPKKIYGK